MPEATQREVRRILAVVGYVEPLRDRALARLDAVVMNPVVGPMLLAVLLFLMFQAVFSWAILPMDAIKAAVHALWAGRHRPRWPTDRCAACWSTA